MTNENVIRETVCNIITTNIEDITLTSADSKVDLSDLGMDSIRFVRMIVALEESFNVEIPAEYLIVSEMNTIEKIVNILFEVLRLNTQDN